MKNIVIFCKNYYPVQSPRSFRATNLAEGFARRGYNVTVYCSMDNRYNHYYYSKKSKVSIENIGETKLGKLRNKRGFFAKAFNFICRKLFIPDFELIFKFRRLSSNLKKNIDLVVSIAFPYEVHWAVMLSRKKSYIWISDCGDPFMGNPILSPPFYFKYIENRWCKLTDYITVPIEEAKRAYNSKFLDKIKVIPQGFNFDNINLGAVNNTSTFKFCYAGNLYKGIRDPKHFLEYLLTLDGIDFQFIVYTKSASFFSEYIEKFGKKLQVKDYIPRSKLLYELSTMNFLINFTNLDNVQQPSKLIDYHLSKRPILNISTEFTAVEKSNFRSFLSGNFNKGYRIENPEQFNIKNVVSNFIKLYNESRKK